MSIRNQSTASDIFTTYSKTIIISSSSTFVIAFWPLSFHRPFYADWVNHVWEINLFQHHLLDHWNFPIVLNEVQSAGNLSPVFYDFLFYPILGTFSLLTGADLAVRALSAGFMLAHMLAFYRICRRLVDRVTSIALATLSTISLYQISNLYNRSALTEFFSQEILLISIATLVLAISSGSKIKSLMLFSAIGLLVTAVGMHPPTAYATAVFCGPALALTLYGIWKAHRFRPSVIHAAVCAIAVLVLLPWVYLVVKYGPSLAISNDPGHFPGTFYFPDSIDSFAARLSPFYIDRRVILNGLQKTSTPFLNASVQTPLFIFTLVMIKVRWSTMNFSQRLSVVLMSSICAGTIALSFPLPYHALVPTAAPFFWILPKGTSVWYDLVIPLQFGYRLSNTASLQVSLILIYLTLATRQGELIAFSPKQTLIFTCLLLITVGGVALHVQSIWDEFIFTEKRIDRNKADNETSFNNRILSMSQSVFVEQYKNSDKYPVTFYGESNYQMNGAATPLNFTGNVTPWVLANFIETNRSGDVTVTCKEACLVQTNLIPSFLIKPTVDGEQVPDGSIVAISSRLSFFHSPGTMKVSFRILGRAIIMFNIARWLGVLWFFISVMIGLEVLRRRLLHIMR